MISLNATRGVFESSLVSNFATLIQDEVCLVTCNSQVEFAGVPIKLDAAVISLFS